MVFNTQLCHNSALTRRTLMQKACRVCNSVFEGDRARKYCSIKCIIQDKSEENEKTGCWEWKASKNNRYGKLRWKGKWISAHRAAYQEYNGKIDNGMLICHSCDNKLCCNPEHLWQGTHKQNMNDMWRKGRASSREKNPFTKFTLEQIDEMKKLKKEGFSIQRICRIFNCTAPYVCHVMKGESHRL